MGNYKIDSIHRIAITDFASTLKIFILRGFLKNIIYFATNKISISKKYIYIYMVKQNSLKYKSILMKMILIRTTLK